MKTLTIFAAAAAAAALPASAQPSAGGQEVNPAATETDLVLEYPVVILPYIDDYYACLKNGNYFIGDGTSFEAQHREDVPRCDKRRTRLEREANERIANSRYPDETPPSQITALFDTIRAIHIARGQELDSTMRARLSTNAEYQAARGHAASIAASDDPEAGRCVERVQGLRAERDAFQAEHSPALEAIYAKDTPTDEDRVAFAAYERNVDRLARLIRLETRSCPAAKLMETAG